MACVVVTYTVMAAVHATTLTQMQRARMARACVHSTTPVPPRAMLVRACVRGTAQKWYGLYRYASVLRLDLFREADGEHYVRMRYTQAHTRHTAHRTALHHTAVGLDQT